jgi:hypothetical protein
MDAETTENSTILIFVPEATSRMEYIFEFIFGNILGVEYRFTTQNKEFQESELPKINYSGTSLSSGLFMKAHAILFEKDLEKQEIQEVRFQDDRLFFPSSEDSFLPFDPFACSFYLITRYEEYQLEHADEHERFTDSDNLLAILGTHQKPVVDQMAYWIAERITGQYPYFTIRNRSFQFYTTIDIDNAWAYKNKSYLVSIGAFLKALLTGQWREVKQRLIVALGIQTDPYDTYSFILSTYQGITDHLKFFFLMGDRNRFDKNISHKNKAFRQLITDLASICVVGIHPSYVSNKKIWLFQKEKERLENIIKRPVTLSRQHYLKLRFPKTYSNLLKSDITNDFTMGFAALVGFRAGTCTPFPFFDLTRNECTELTIHPFQVMDVTLKNYLHLDPEEAGQLIDELMREVKKVNGTFVSLWHNESLKDSGHWSGWRRVFEKLHQNGLKLQNE